MQTWFVFLGDNDDLDAYDTVDTVDGGHISVDVGEGSFIPVSNDLIIFTWDFVLDLDDLSADRPTPWCRTTECGGEVWLTRLTQPIPCATD